MTLAIRWNTVDDLDSADGSLHLHVGAVITSLRGWQFAMSATPGFFFFFLRWIGFTCYMFVFVMEISHSWGECSRQGTLPALGVR
jgi:hypothetical protein